MNEVSEALMRRIAKILALAERGVDGEKAAAESMLANILAKHGLTMADIEGKPARQWVEVRFVGEHERRLMLQIVRKVTQHSGDLTIRQIPKTRSRLYVQLSAAEHVEVEFMFEVMRSAFAKEVEHLMTAFIHRNRIFGASVERDDDDDTPEPEVTPERRAELRRIAAMMNVMSPVDLKKAIAS